MLRTEPAQALPGKADAETYWRWEQQNSVCELHTEMQEETKPEYTSHHVCETCRDQERNKTRIHKPACVRPAETKKETRP